MAGEICSISLQTVWMEPEENRLEIQSKIYMKCRHSGEHRVRRGQILPPLHILALIPHPLNDSISNKVTQSSVSFKQFHSSAQLSQFKLKGRIVIPQHTVIQYMLIYVL